MTLRDLIESTSYKCTFNHLYKIYYKGKKYTKDQLIEADMEYKKICDNLISQPLNPNESYKIYITQAHSDSNVLDVCILDKSKDEMLPVDIFKHLKLVDMEIYEALKLKSHQSLACILHFIFGKYVITKIQNKGNRKNLWSPKWKFEEEK